MPHMKEAGLTDALAAILLHANDLVPADTLSSFDADVGAVINELRPQYAAANVPRATNPAAHSWLKLEAPEETAAARFSPWRVGQNAITQCMVHLADVCWAEPQLNDPRTVITQGSSGLVLITAYAD